MATIYCDILTGNDANDGSIASPVKNLRRAIWQSVSGDTIACSGSTVDNPHRGQIIVPAGVTIKSATAGTPVYITGSADISDGAVYTDEGTLGEFSKAGSLAEWDTSTPFNVSEDSTTANLWGLTGVNAQSLTFTGDNSQIRRDVVMKDRKMRFRLGYKCATGGYIVLGMAQTMTAADHGAPSTSGRYRYDWANKRWSTDSNPGYPAVDADGNAFNSTTWTEQVTDWFTLFDGFDPSTTPNSNTGNYIYIRSEDAGAQIQYIIAEVMAEWAAEGTADVYQLPYRPSNDRTYTSARILSVAGRTSPYHGTTAVTGVYYATNAADYTTYGISEGDAVTDPPTGDLTSYVLDPFIKIKIPTGASISDYSLFVSQADNSVEMTGTGAALIDVSTICTQRPLLCTGAITCAAERFNSFVSLRELSSSSGATLTVTGGAFYEPAAATFSKQHGGGVVVDATSTLTCNGLHVQNAGDDSFQAVGGTLNLYGCTESGANGEGIEINAAGGATANIKNVTLTGSYRDQSANTTTVSMSGLVCATIEMDQNQTRTYTVATNCQCEASAVSYTGGALAVANLDNNFNFDYVPDYDATTFIPNAGSALIGTGVKWWGSAPRPVGSNGKPFPDFDIDAGGVQSAHSPHDPSNI